MISYDRILEELQRRAADKPASAETVAFYTALLSAQSRAEPKYSKPVILAQEATARLESGRPILDPEAFRADRVVLATLCHRVCILTVAHRPELAAALDAIRNWLCAEQASILTFAARYLDEGRVRQGEEAGLDRALLAFVFNQALHPFLRKHARTLAPFVDENIWYRPYCPICGGEPNFAALTKTGTRRLLCSRCDFEWEFWRVTCPFCGCDDPEMQKHSDVNGDGALLSECGRCGKAIKTLDLRRTEEERLLPVERILMLAMDLTAPIVG